MFKLFGTKEKSCCSGNCTADSLQEAEQTMNNKGILILGTGCKKCNQLEKNVKEALDIMQKDIAIDHITDLAQIASFGVLTTPALAVNGKVVSYGKILSSEQIIKILEQEDA